MAIIRHYPLNRTEFEEKYDSDAACYGAIARITLRKEMKCPRCGGEAGGTMVMASVESRGVPWKKQLWQCRRCRHKFNALGNTMLAGTKLPLRTWFRLFWWMCATDEPTSARKAFAPETQAEQGFQIKQERSAWTALQRIRRAMMSRGKLSGSCSTGFDRSPAPLPAARKSRDLGCNCSDTGAICRHHRYAALPGVGCHHPVRDPAHCAGEHDYNRQSLLL